MVNAIVGSGIDDPFNAYKSQTCALAEGYSELLYFTYPL